MGFKENLKDELKYQDIKVKELAEMTGIPKGTLDHYLAEKCSAPLADAAVKIAQALNVSVEYLVTGNTVTLDKLKPEVMSISKILNRFSEKDLKLISDLINRLEKK